MLYFLRMNRLQKASALLLLFAMLFSLSACGGSAAPDPNAGLYKAVSAEMWGISVNIADVFEDGFSLELKSGGKAVFHYDGKDYNLKWTLEGDSFHAEGGGAELNGTLAYGEMRLTNVLDSGMEILLVCDELVPNMLDGPGEIADPEAREPEAGENTSSLPEAEPEAVRYEPVTDALATLPVYDAKQAMAMSNWMYYGYCVIEDNMFYGRYFLQKAGHATLVALELRREGASVKGGKWTELDGTCWPNFVQKQGDTLYYLKCEHGGSDCFAVARVDIAGSSPQVLYEGMCNVLSVTQDRLFFTDASYRLLSINLDGGEPQVVLDKEVYYSYALNDDWILYQDDADSESLHLYYLPEGLDFALNSERSYEPVLYGSRLFYSTVTEDVHYLRCIDLSSYEERYDEALGCHVPVYTVETGDNPYDEGFLLDGTSIIDFLTQESFQLENWKGMASSPSTGTSRNLRYISEDLMIVDVHGTKGGVRSIQFIDRASGTVSTIHWLH